MMMRWSGDHATPFTWTVATQATFQDELGKSNEKTARACRPLNQRISTSKVLLLTANAPAILLGLPYC